jgi:hypothetical protein
MFSRPCSAGRPRIDRGWAVVNGMEFLRHEHHMIASVLEILDVLALRLRANEALPNALLAGAVECCVNLPTKDTISATFPVECRDDGKPPFGLPESRRPAVAAKA